MLLWLCAWLPTAAAAPVPRAEDGEGIKAGQRSTFHAGFALVTGVDSNVFYDDRSEGPRAAAFIFPSAWLGIGNRALRDGLLMSPAERSGRILDYNISLLGGFRQYLARRDTLRQQSRFSVGTQIRLALLPGRRFSVHLDEDFFRQAEPSNFEAGGSFNFNRIMHSGDLTFIGRPGGGRVQLSFSYLSRLLVFENTDFDVKTGDRLVNGGQFEGKWRFLPKSSLLVRYSLLWTFYLQCCAEIGQGRNEDNFGHRILAGYRGELRKKIVLDVLGGAGLGFYRDDVNGPDFRSFIGEVNFNYFPTLQSQIHASVYRSFSDSLLGNFFVDNGARAAVRWQFRWRMIGTLGLGVAGRRYRGLPEPGVEDGDITGYSGNGAGNLDRRDVLFTTNVKIEQPLGRIWSLALGYDLTVDSTNYTTTFSNGFVDDAGFIKHWVMLFGAVRI